MPFEVEWLGRKVTMEELRAMSNAGDVADVPADNGRVDGGHGNSHSDARTRIPSINGLSPTEGQARGIEAVCQLMKKGGPGGVVIVGYAGVGKTTLIRAFGQLFPGPLVITPTGKAAVRVHEATGMPAQTAHRWLYHTGEGAGGGLQFTVKGSDKLQLPFNKLVIVDEASMLGLTLFNDIWRTCQRHGLKLVLIGDGFQLPPVAERGAQEPFNVLTPKFATEKNFVRVELTEILRQAADSPIIRASMGLRNNEGIAAITSNIQQVKAPDFFQAAAQVFGEKGIVIAHANFTRQKINRFMRQNYGLVEVVRDEPLMLLANNYTLGVYNGEQLLFDQWTVGPRMDQETQVTDRYSKASMPVHFGAAVVEGHACVLSWEELFGLNTEVSGRALADAGNKWAKDNGHKANGEFLPYLSANFGYCYTAHKAQGSEWPYALVLLEQSVKLREEEGRRWAYTALTRAKLAAAVCLERI